MIVIAKFRGDHFGVSICALKRTGGVFLAEAVDELSICERFTFRVYLLVGRRIGYVGAAD
jgi:hypothetical protein